MFNIFEVIDKTGRKIHLSKERWSHIRKKHPEMENYEEILMTLENPDKISSNLFDETTCFYVKYFKHKKSPKNYIVVLC